MSLSLILHETFADKGLLEEWCIEVGEWRLADGALSCVGYGMIYIPLPERVYYDSLEIECDVCASQPRGIDLGIGSYLFTFGVEDNALTRITRNQETVARTLDCSVERGKKHHMVARVAGGLASLTIDGKEVLQASVGMGPLLDEASLIICGEAAFSNVRVRGEAAASANPAKRIAEKKEQYQFHVAVDFEDDILRAPFTLDMFEQMVAHLAELGVSRIYWMNRGGTDSGFWDLRRNDDAFSNNVKATIESMGDFLPAIVEAAHARGIEVYSLIKPFDMAWPYTVPPGEGAGVIKGPSRMKRIGGEIRTSVNFLRENPGLRIERNMAGIEDASADQTVRSIRFIKHDDKPTRIGKEHLQIWVSDDNTNYRRYERPFEFRDGVEDRCEQVYETQGNSTGTNRQSVRVISLDGLEITETYFAVTTSFGDEDGTFKNWLYALVEIISDEGRAIPFTYGLHVRGDGWKTGEDFRQRGFEFDYEGSGKAFSLGPANSYLRSAMFWDGKSGNLLTQAHQKNSEDRQQVIGFARGKNRYLHGAPCGAYREVKDYWLSWVKRAIDAGVDGVDFRVRNHNMSFEWEAYGFNEPIVEEYKKRYGVDIRTQDFDREKWRRLRGEHYTAFLGEARGMLQAVGKKLQLHICDAMNLEPSGRTMMEIHWDWRRWIEEGLVDAITFKEVKPNTIFYDEVKALAEERNLPTFFCPFFFSALGYDHCKHSPQKLFQLSSDAGDDGFILYECASFIEGRRDGTVELMYPELKQVITTFRR